MKLIEYSIFQLIFLILDQTMMFELPLMQLCSHAKLDRDKGAIALKAEIIKTKQDHHDTSLEEFGIFILSFLNSTEQGPDWETVFGYFQATLLLLETESMTDAFMTDLQCCALVYIEHSEFRIRIIAGEVLGKLCQLKTMEMYRSCEEKLMDSIRHHLERQIPDDPMEAPLFQIGNNSASSELHNEDAVNQVATSLADAVRKNAKDIFHDTAGWKCLETSMKSLQAVIEGCGERFHEFISQALLKLVFDTLNHTNRFVRETGFYVCAALARYGISYGTDQNKVIGGSLAIHLKGGLADNWSQVRLAASVATRQFFLDMDMHTKDKYFALLLPPMCLNRYYLAEGVRLYNAETWKIVFGLEGKSYVEKYINEVVDFYVLQTQSDNHAVREAACHCMAELGVKISKEVVQPYISQIHEALLVCFKDESWPVRDTACVACGNFVQAFPDDSKDYMANLYPLFFLNLRDPIPSVRQGAAIALTNVAKAYGAEAIPKIFETVTVGLKEVDSQPATADRFSSISKTPATYGVVKRLHDNDPSLHSNQQMFSCGSLAPKMRRGGGCSDHTVKRPSEPWEMTDGCISLLGEMSSVEQAHIYVINVLPLVVTAAEHKHYIQHVHLLETICRELLKIAVGLGKRLFKPHLEQFFEPVFAALNCDNALTKVAACDCLDGISKFIGPNILRGRIEQYNGSYLHQFEQVLRSANGIP